MSLFCGRVRAQADNEVTLLRTALREQANQQAELLVRLQELEAGQTNLLARIETLATAPTGTHATHDMIDDAMDELREEYLDLQDRLDNLPNLSGYYDFEYFNDDRKNSPGRFRQHHVSLHLTKEWDQWRMFTEFEFEFGTLIEGDGIVLEKARGEIKLEQAWAEYIHSDKLTFRGGLILTPGYWNVNHYPNVVLSTRRPLVVRKVFRESFIGIMAYGTKRWDDLGVTYYGYLGNGQSPLFTKTDDNEGKAVGGKVTLHLPSETLDQFDIGLSFYQESPDTGNREFTWGTELQVKQGPWQLLSELAFKSGNDDRAGAYFQPSYRFNQKWATFYRYDLLTVEHEGDVQEHTVGVNYRPIPDVSLKLEYFHSRQSKDEDFSGIAASVAVHF